MFDVRHGVCRPPANYMLLAFEKQIVRYVIQHTENNNLYSKSFYNFNGEPFIILPIEDVGWPTSIQVDTLSLHRFIYWIDTGSNGQIFKLKRASDIFPTTVSFIFKFYCENMNFFAFISFIY